MFKTYVVCASTPGERADAKHLGAGLSNFGGGGDVGNSLGTGLDSVGGADAKHEDLDVFRLPCTVWLLYAQCKTNNMCWWGFDND